MMFFNLYVLKYFIAICKENHMNFNTLKVSFEYVEDETYDFILSFAAVRVSCFSSDFIKIFNVTGSSYVHLFLISRIVIFTLSRLEI